MRADREGQPVVYDVLIIGAGVTGCAIAREMSRYELTIGVLEQGSDVASGTSKANSGIIHAGYDAPTGSLMARLNVTGARQMERTCQELSVPYRRTGSLVVSSDSQAARAELQRLLQQGIANGVTDLRLVTKEEISRLVPMLNPNLEVGLYAPTAAVVPPYELTIALAENAVQNGVSFLLGRKVTSMIPQPDALVVHSGTERYEARLVINAAGVYADQVAAMLQDRSFSIIPYKGQELILDKQYGKLADLVVFPLPTPVSKGIVVAPTPSGNLLIGPTAEIVDNPSDTSTTREGQLQVLDAARHLIPAISSKGVITSYAGLRAVADTGDFIIRSSEQCKRLLHVAGIKSPGLSAVPAIAEMVIGLISERLRLTPKNTFCPLRSKAPRPLEIGLAKWHELIKLDPAYGRMICRCEQVSEGEIRDALRGVLPPTTVDGLKRRLRVGMGRCQGGFCLPHLISLIAEYRGLDAAEVTKQGSGSEFILGRVKANPTGGDYIE